MADDLGNADLGYRGGEVQSPNIDKLATEGVRLESFYGQQVCTPSRAALMTGRSPMRLGLQTLVIFPSHSYGLPTEKLTLPQALKEAGYETWMVGKWHLGHADRKFWPQNRGSDRFYGNVMGEVDYFTRGKPGPDHRIAGVVAASMPFRPFRLVSLAWQPLFNGIRAVAAGGIPGHGECGLPTRRPTSVEEGSLTGCCTKESARVMRHQALAAALAEEAPSGPRNSAPGGKRAVAGPDRSLRAADGRWGTSTLRLETRVGSWLAPVVRSKLVPRRLRRCCRQPRLREHRRRPCRRTGI